MNALLGWAGAVVVLASYAQRREVRLRQVNLIAGCLLFAYHISNLAWPAVALEIAVATVNLRRLYQHRRASHVGVSPASIESPAWKAG